MYFSTSEQIALGLKPRPESRPDRYQVPETRQEKAVCELRRVPLKELDLIVPIFWYYEPESNKEFSIATAERK